jgi:hypothetical protein
MLNLRLEHREYHRIGLDRELTESGIDLATQPPDHKAIVLPLIPDDPDSDALFGEGDFDLVLFALVADILES